MSASSPPLSFGFMRRHPAHLLALGFGSGLSPVAPGTAGTLAGWLTFTVLNLWLTDWLWALICLLGFPLGVWCSQKVIDELQVHDHPGIVWDEILAFWLVLWVAWPIATGWIEQLVLFGLFRFFDAVKPMPISWLDKNVKGGFGVMVDDLAAAVATLFVYALGFCLLAGGE
ncbi:MAG: phosphatidylglycerophosphatase A family protein [Burkholderiaceae bacterium]